MISGLWRRFLESPVGSSVFRVGIPGSNLERARIAVESFFLHVQPAKVRLRTLRFETTLGLGLVSLYLFLILTATGVLLMFYYVPSPAHAYGNMKDLEFVVSGGVLMRNMHRWAAHMMVAAVVLHLCRVFYTAAYKPPREFNWVVGVVLLLLTLALSFTGYLLPWDQLAFWAITVGTSIAGYAPVVGEKMRFLMLGGDSVGEAALLRFYVLHVAVLPGAAALLIGLHLWRIRKDGGLARPAEAAPLPREYDAGELPRSKTYGLMELARGTTSAVGSDPEEEAFAWPHLLFREGLLFLAVLALLLLFSLLWNAPLEELANPAHPPNPAKAPWYFLGLQELVAHSAFWGGIVAPGVLTGALLALPYLDRRRDGVGEWFSPKRRVVVAVFTACLVAAASLTLIGTAFRGPNWDFKLPWSAAAAGER